MTASLAPRGLTSNKRAALIVLALADLSTDTWLAWRLRLLTNTLAVFTLVPPLVLAATRPRPRPRRAGLLLRRGSEAGALLAGLLVIAILVFALPEGGLGRSPLLLNVMGFLQDEEVLGRARRRVFLDIDPGFGQMWKELGLADVFRGHDDFVTIGENIGRPGCSKTSNSRSLALR